MYTSKSKNKRKRCRSEKAERDVKSCKNTLCGGLIYKAYAWSSQGNTSKMGRLFSRNSGEVHKAYIELKSKEKKIFLNRMSYFSKKATAIRFQQILV